MVLGHGYVSTWLLSLNITPPYFHTHFALIVIFTRRTNWENWEFSNSVVLSDIMEPYTAKYFHVVHSSFKDRLLATGYLNSFL